MPLDLLLYPSFDRSLKKLGFAQREIAQRILTALKIYYLSNCNLEEARKLETRFFYKQLRKPYFEAGIEEKIRIIIERDGTECYAVLVCDHDHVRQFLKD